MTLRPTVLLFAALLALSAPSSTRSAATAAESLGQPCRAFNVLAGTVVTDPGGREWFVLTNMNEASGMELIFIDPATDSAKSYRAPAGAGSWALLQVPGDRLVVGTYYDGSFLVFDLRSMSFVKTARVPGESYIWNLALGSDGRVYGGTYRGGKLAALDLDTYEVEDLGRPPAAGANLYLRNVASTPDGRILCRFGTAEPVSLLFDPKTKSFGPVPPPLVNGRGVTWNKNYFIAGRQVFSGPDLAPVDPPPFPTPGEKWEVNLAATKGDRLVVSQGDALFVHRAGEQSLTKVFDGDLRNGHVFAATRAGDLLGVRGAEYFVLSPGKPVQLRRIPVELAPRQTHFLRHDDRRGRLWGGPTFGQTVFWLDAKTKAYENTAKVCDGGGEVYDAAFIDGMVYFVAYAGGDVIAYDPEQPWDQWNGRNPRTIASVKGMGKGYIRPVAGVTVGPDRKLYAGWMVGYGSYGGAVSITDPATGKTELIENPLGVEQAVSGLAVDAAGLLYVGTSLGGNGLPAKSGERPRFGVYDRAGKSLVFEKTFDRATSVGNILHDAAAGRVLLTADAEVHLFDPAAKTFKTDKKWPRLTSHGFAGRGDGRAYYANAKQVYVMDLKAGTVAPFAAAPAKVETITAGPGGEVYVSCGPDVYRLTATGESAR